MLTYVPIRSQRDRHDLHYVASDLVPPATGCSGPKLLIISIAVMCPRKDQ